MKKIISLVVSALLLMTSLNIAVMAAPVVDADTGVITIDAVADLDESSTVTKATDWVYWSNGSVIDAVYKVTVPEGKGGMYLLSASAFGFYNSTEHVFAFKYVNVNGTPNITGGVTGAVTYTGNGDSGSNWGVFKTVTPGIVNLSEGENTITICMDTKNSTTTAVKYAAVESFTLTPVDEDTYEMIDTEGKCIIPINKTTAYTLDDSSKQIKNATNEYLEFMVNNATSNLINGSVTFDVYTQKAGRYTLTGDIWFGEYGDWTDSNGTSYNYVYYYNYVDVNGTSVYTGSSSTPIASAATVTAQTKVKKDACVIELEEGKNTITVQVTSNRGKNYYRIYGYELNEFIPQFDIPQGETLTIKTTEANAISFVEEGGWSDPAQIRMRFRSSLGNNPEHYAEYKVIAPEAGEYTLGFGISLIDGKALGLNFGYKVYVDGVLELSNPAIANTGDLDAVYTTATQGPRYRFADIGNITLKEGANIIKITPYGVNQGVVVDLHELTLSKATFFIDTFSLSATAFDADETVTATATIEDAAKAPAGKDVFIFIAKYDSLGELINVDFTKWNGTDDSITASITADSDTDEIKAFLWTDDLTPLKTIPAIKKKQQ